MELNGFEAAVSKLGRVNNSRELQHWVRNELRRLLPHAAFLGTLGKLYGIGSVPSHRLSVDYPLNMVEELKNVAGAIDDPLMYVWFRNERLRHIEIADVDEFGDQQEWRKVLLQHGIRSMLIHGVLDPVKKRFAVFQICNPAMQKSPELAGLFSALMKPLYNTAWSTVDNKQVKSPRFLVGHPTLSLTPTELHIIQLLAQGLSNKEIARLRGVSDSTVKTQVSRTGVKLGATRRAEIVAIAMPLVSPLPAQNLLDYRDIQSNENPDY